MVAPLLILGGAALIALFAGNAGAASTAVGPRHSAFPALAGADPNSWGPAYTNLSPQEKVRLLESKGIPLSQDPALNALLARSTPAARPAELATPGEVFPVAVVPTPAAQASAAPVAPSAVPMTAALQLAMGNALKLLTVDDQGNIRGPVTRTAVRAASQIAGRLDAAGFPEAADTLRTLTARAAKMVPPPKVQDLIPLPDTLSPELQARVQMMIQNERDPAKLQNLVDALMLSPQNDERDLAVQTLRALILQLETANITQESLEKADAVMKAPTPAPEPPVIRVEPSTPVITPSAPEPAPKTPVQQAAEGMALHLKLAQSRHGMPGAKGREDKGVVVRFQRLAGISQDGKAGPGTLGKAASVGQGDLPLVMYWPRGSSRSSVQTYRNTLRRLADATEAQGFSGVANQMRMSANMEKGQAGIAQFGPALT